MNSMLIIAAVRAIAGIVPTLVGSNDGAKAAGILNLLATLGERGVESEADVAELTRKLEAMQGVSTDEMSALLADVDDLHTRIQAAKISD